MDYVSTNRPDGCFLCEIHESDTDEADLLLARRSLTLVVLNRFPYNTGHLVLAPVRHLADLADLTEQERAELMEVTVECIGALNATMEPQGINFGANLGEAAGAGVPDHLHLHVVPRWTGDTNFMPVVGKAKVLPESLEATYKRLKPFF